MTQRNGSPDKPLRMLFIGDLWDGSNATSLRNGFLQTHLDVRSIDTTWVQSHVRGNSRNPLKGIGRESPDAKLEQKLKHAQSDGWMPDIVFAFKQVRVSQSLLLDLPGVHVHYSPDDLSNPANTSDAYLASEAQWDLICTTKSFNVAELEARGVVRSLYVPSAYDPVWHKPTNRPFDGREFLAGFVGALRRDRKDLPAVMARAIPNRGVIYGPRWRRAYWLPPAGVCLRGPTSGTGFAEAAGNFRAGIVLLNSDNRDLHTCRSFEMSACRLAIIAERTSEHLALYGDTAIYFDDMRDLERALQSMPTSSSVLEEMSVANYERIVEGRHTYRDRAEAIIRAMSKAGLVYFEFDER